MGCAFKWSLAGAMRNTGLLTYEELLVELKKEHRRTATGMFVRDCKYKGYVDCIDDEAHAIYKCELNQHIIANLEQRVTGIRPKPMLVGIELNPGPDEEEE